MMKHHGADRLPGTLPAFCRRLAAATVVVALVTTPQFAPAQSATAIEPAIEAFQVECGAALNDPESYYRAARDGGEDGPLMVTESADGTVHWIMDIRYPVVFSAQIGEIDQRTVVDCDDAVILEASEAGLDANNDTFLSAMDAIGSNSPVGGAMEVSGVFSEVDGTPRTIYEHAVSNWLEPGQVVVASVQPDLFRLTAHKTFNRPFSIEE